MKKGLKCLLVLCLLGLLAACGTKTDSEIETVTGTREEIAQAFIQALADGDYDKLEKGFVYDEEMEKVSGQLKSLFSTSMDALGALVKIQPAQEMTQGEYMIESVPVCFENQNININVVFDANNAIAGVNFSEYIEPSSAAELELPEGALEIELTMTARDGKEIPGTLTLPKGEDKVPVVLLVHGSGPNDRDETIYANTVFKDIAWLLAEKGIATFRYDKRTYLYAEEMADDTQMTVYDETINDAVDAFAWLATQERIDADRIYILGHSLGGLCIPRIAAETNAAGYIMLAAPASDMATLMREQIEYLSQFASDADKTVYDAVLAELDKLNDPDSLAEDEAIQGAYPAYWIDLLEYDPIETAQSISAPVLVLQGEEDYQVPMAEYELWKAAYGDKANWEFHSYSGLSHLMMPGSLSEAPTSYYLRKQTVDTRVTDDIAAFINQ